MTELNISYATRPWFLHGVLHLEIRCQNPSSNIRLHALVRLMEQGRCSFKRIMDIVEVDDNQRRAVVRVGEP